MVQREDANREVSVLCPFQNIGNPLPFCTWSRTDANNVTHPIELGGRIRSQFRDCDITFSFFRVTDNGLYHCTGHNIIGNVTYTFPERFVAESE